MLILTRFQFLIGMVSTKKKKRKEEENMKKKFQFLIGMVSTPAKKVEDQILFDLTVSIPYRYGIYIFP